MFDQAPPFNVAIAAPATLVVITLGYYFWWRSCEYARYRKCVGSASIPATAGQSLPSPAAVLPAWLGSIGGHTFNMETDKITEQMEGWAEELGGDYQLDAYGTKIIAVTGLSEMRRILSLRPTKFKRDFSSGNMVWAAGQLGVLPSLFFDEGKEWGKSRRLISPSLAGHNIAGMLPFVAKVGERLCEKLGTQADAGEIVHARSAFNHFLHDVIAWGLYGMDVDSIRATEGRPCPSFEAMNTTTRALSALMLQPIKMLGWMTLSSLLPWVRIAKQHAAELRKVVQAAIDSARSDLKVKGGAAMPATGDGDPDEELSQRAGKMLRKIVSSTKDSGDGTGGNRMALANEDILPQLKSLFIAGTETTSLSISWTLYYLIKHPEMYARCRREALEAAPMSDGMVSTIEQVSKLVFCSAVFKEVARLRPGSALLFLHSTDTYTMQTGLELEKGTSFCLLTRLPSKSDDNFTRAADFVPERWIEAEREEALVGKGGKEGRGAVNHVLDAFMAFGSGPRVCPGQDLAKMKGVAVLAAICARFDVSLAPGQADPPEEIFEFVLGPRDINLVFKKKS